MDEGTDKMMKWLGAIQASIHDEGGQPDAQKDTLVNLVHYYSEACGLFETLIETRGRIFRISEKLDKLKKELPDA